MHGFFLNFIAGDAFGFMVKATACDDRVETEKITIIARIFF